MSVPTPCAAGNAAPPSITPDDVLGFWETDKNPPPGFEHEMPRDQTTAAATRNNRVGAVAVAALEVLADVVRDAVTEYSEAAADLGNETAASGDVARAVAVAMLPRYGRNPDGLQVLKAAQGIIRRAAVDRSMFVSLPDLAPVPFAEHFRGLAADPKPGGMVRRLAGGSGVATAVAAMIIAGSVIRLTAIHTASEIEDEALAVALSTMADCLAYGLQSETVLAEATARMGQISQACSKFMAAASSSVAD